MHLEPLDAGALPGPVDVSENGAALEAVDAVIAGGPYEATWASLSRYTVPRWYTEAKFGIFIHWGAYSVPAFENEWYPRNMYRQGTPAFEHHRATYGAEFGYKDFLPHFRMENFSADEWVALFKRAGAQYVVPVAEHHDGYAMYATRRSRWSTSTVGPERDVFGELLRAVDEAWLMRGASSHRAEHWFFMNGGTEYDSDVRDPRYSDLYGPALRKEISPTERFLEDWLLRSIEIVDTYRPQLLYFDAGVEEPSFEPYLRRFAAYYYNRAAQWGREVVINDKWNAFARGAAVLDVERGTMSGISPQPWQNDTSVSRTSWSWVEGHEYKTASELIAELADVVSKNGNLLLNVGPRPDGTIAEHEVELLERIGRWLSVNGESIYGTAPWAVFGEGPTEPVAGSFADGAAPQYTGSDIRFTTMTEVGHRYVYAIALAAPSDGRLRIRSFGGGSRLLGAGVREVRVLGHRGPVESAQTAEALEVAIPAEVAPSDGGPVVRIELEPEQERERIDFFHGLWI